MNLKTFPKDNSTFLLKGPVGNLEVATAAPRGASRAITAIICHPHPLHGGTMQNKVVTTIARTFSQMGMHTIRFNFRGVGKSEGDHGGGITETDDLLAIVEWARNAYPENEFWLAGFSFGSYVAANGANLIPKVAQLISIAPPVHHMGFANLKPACPWLVIQPDNDEIVPPDAVYQWVENHEASPQLITINDASHFFHGRLIELQTILKNEFAADQLTVAA